MTTFRVVLATIVTLVVLVVLWSWLLLRPGPPIRLSKQTTYITEPLAADGLPDYVAYLNAKYGEGVTPENNATVLLAQATGVPNLRGEDRAIWFERLGIEALPESGEYLVAPDADTAITASADWIVGFWRGQRAGGEPPQTMPTVDEYTQQVAESVSDKRDRLWMGKAQEAARLLNSRALRQPWADEQIPSLAAWLRANDQFLDQALLATQRSRSYVPLIAHPDASVPPIYSILHTTVRDVRTLKRALSARVMRNLGEQRFSEAHDDIVGMHGVARLSGGWPFLVHYFVGIDVDAWACQQQVALAGMRDVPPNILEASLAEVRTLKRWRQGAHVINGAERFAMLDAALWLSNTPNAERVVGAYDEPTVLKLAHSSPNWNTVLEHINGYYDDAVNAMRLSDRARRDEEIEALYTRLRERLDSESGRSDDEGIQRQFRSERLAAAMTERLVGDVRSVLRAEDRANAWLDLTAVALALGVYRSHAGVYPDSLDQLVSDILVEAPSDPFAKSSLRYERRGDGYLLYSVGENGRNDGGSDSTHAIVNGEWRPDDVAMSPVGGEDDLVVRVPMPRLEIPSLPDDVLLPPLGDAAESSTADDAGTNNGAETDGQLAPEKSP